MPLSIIKQSVYRHRLLVTVILALCLFSLVYYAANSYRLSPKGVKESLESYISQEEAFFNSVATSKATVLALTIHRDSLLENSLQQATTGIFSYAVNDLGNPIALYWSTSQMSINSEDLKTPDSAFVVTYQNGLFEVLKKEVLVNGKKYIIAGLVPLHWKYFIENKYLPEKFEGASNISNQYKISTNAYEATAIKNSYGKTLFYVERIAKAGLSQTDAPNTILHIAIVLLLVVFLIYTARLIMVAGTFKHSVLFLAISLFLLRLVIYYSSFIVFTNFNISSELLLGATVTSSDFLISTFFIFVLVAFLFFFQKKIIYPARLNSLIAVACLCFLAFLTNITCDIVEALLFTLQGSFDITNFFNLNVYTAVGFVILVFIVLTYYYLSWLTMIASYKAGFPLAKSIAIVVAAGLFLLTFQLESSTAVIKLATLVWLAGYLVILNLRRSDRQLSLFQSPFFLIWVIIFAVSMSYLLVELKKRVDFQQRQELAAQLARQPDPYSEHVLRVAVNGLSDTFLIRSYRRFYDETANHKIKDSIINANFSGYLNKFDTRIYIFDALGRGLYNDDEMVYPVIDNIIRNSIIRYRNANSEGFYFLKSNSNAYSYLFKKDVIMRDSGLIGHVVVFAKPKKYKTDAIYPELFRQAGDIQTLLDNYLYAVYEDNYLSNFTAGYSFSDTLSPYGIPRTQFEERTKNEYSELWYKASNNKVIVLVRKKLATAEFLTLFAVLFLCIILFVCLIEMAAFFMRQRRFPTSVDHVLSFNIRTQVQTTIILLSLFSFIIIGFITIRFFISRFNTSTEEKLVKTMQVITNEIQDATRSQLIFSDWEAIGSNTDIDRKIVEIANLNNTDINLYDVTGKLKLSTQPYIYNKQILSNRMQPQAFDMLRNNHRVLYMQKEFVNSFSFVSIYAPVKNDNDETIAYLNIPYLNSGIEVNQEISNLLVTLINLNAVIFALSSVVAIFLTRSIISSLVQIGNRMRNFNFGGKIEKIEWEKKDEISVLVSAFNQMVQRLEESAAALARSERAGAWQEMARQVAHEIKNPLTPMKLSAQYLQRAIQSNAANVKELALNMSSTLIEQTDQLAKIAGDFSQFANINQAKPEVMNLSQMIESLCRFHETGSSAEIVYTEPEEDFTIYADKAQMNRLFTNLLKNAEEAANPDNEDELTIEVRQVRKRDCVRVIIIDNGTGIPADKLKHIFEPNFTTKTSGTGLGLAICKRITENAGGKIWFETVEGKGTTFFIELPLMSD